MIRCNALTLRCGMNTLVRTGKLEVVDEIVDDQSCVGVGEVLETVVDSVDQL